MFDKPAEKYYNSSLVDRVVPGVYGQIVVIGPNWPVIIRRKVISQVHLLRA
jgi:hypothetical protein